MAVKKAKFEVKKYMFYSLICIGYLNVSIVYIYTKILIRKAIKVKHKAF